MFRALTYMYLNLTGPASRDIVSARARGGLLGNAHECVIVSIVVCLSL